MQTPLVRIERQVIAQDRIESFSYNKGVSPEPPGGKHSILFCLFVYVYIHIF